MENKYLFTLYLLLISPFIIVAQNTIGNIINTIDSYNAYTLFTVDKNTYLIDNCGQVINKWTSEFNSGKSVYLLPDGSLLRTEHLENGFVSIPGIGGKVSIRDWDNNLTWEYNFSNDISTQHHDVFPLSNGNILVLIAELRTKDEAILAGRNLSNLITDELYNEKIIEIKPIGTNDIQIVWEWNIWDHLIQDFNNGKNNFGNVAQNPQLLDINYLGFSSGNNNWLHVNSIQYNERLDQIIISARQLSELYIIDHSTTTEEAKTHEGGSRGKGGDFLYRWGNPLAYKMGIETDQKLFGQHFPHWIPDELEDGGKILVFNNGFSRTPNYSSVDIIIPPQDQNDSYIIPNGEKIGPSDFDWSYTDPTEITNFYSNILSSAQRLPNGNTLICEGVTGVFFEIDRNKKIVWKYINPIAINGPLSQGESPNDVQSVFRATKYSLDYEAFIGKDLTPGNPIELNFDLSNCEILSTPTENNLTKIIMPNPVRDNLHINTNYIVERVEVYNIQGKKVLLENRKKSIDFTKLSNGIYFVRVFSNKGIINKKIIKI